MDDHIIISVRHNGESKLISVTNASSYDEFAAQVNCQWSMIDPIHCLCSVGSMTNVCLVSEADFQNIIFLCKLSNVRIVLADLLISLAQPLDIAPPSLHTPSLDTFSPPLQATGSSHSEIGEELCKEVSVQVLYDFNSSSESVQHAVPQDRKRSHSGQYMEFFGETSLPNFEMCPHVKKKVFLSNCWADIMKQGIGSIFRGGAVEYRKELIKYTAQLGFRFKYKRNYQRYISVICNEDPTSLCEWFINARQQPVTLYYEITKANFTHKCTGRLIMNETKRISPRILGDLVLQNVISTPSVTGKDIKKQIKDGYALEVPYWKAHRAAEKAREQIYGNFDDSYDQLRWYCEAIKRTNPGSVVSPIANSVSHEFEMIFIGIHAGVQGFKSCRPMLFVDGTFMKGRSRGTLLSATAKDGNNGLFPVAFAIVSAETEVNWQWFLTMLRDNVKHDKPICYISNRNLGLLAAFPLVFEAPIHFYCLFHLLTNLKGRFQGKSFTAIHRQKLVEKFRDCAYAPNKRIFDDRIKEFKDIGGNVAEQWIESIKDFKKWAVSHSPEIARYGEMTSNAAESFNMWIHEARSFPITHMIDYIINGLTKWYVEMWEDSKGWTGLLVDLKNGLWHYYADNGRGWYVTASPGGEFHVSSTPSVIVDMEKRSCTCFQWQISGFPCVHAVTVISRQRIDPAKYVDGAFLTSSYKASYSMDIHHIPETEKFEYQGEFGTNRILLPTLKRPPGRPKKERIPSYGEFRQHKNVFKH